MLNTVRSALLVLLFATLPFVPAAASDHDAQKAVLVTGATSGIGLKIAERLARLALEQAFIASVLDQRSDDGRLVEHCPPHRRFVPERQLQVMRQ